MSNAREEILARIRQSTRQNASANDSEAIARKYLEKRARGVLPAFSETPLDRFTAMAQQASASVIKIGGISELGDAIDCYLDEQQLIRKIVAAPSALLDDVIWPTDCEVERRIAQASDQVGVSVAFAGIAETGTLALLSGQDTPTTLNFLPDNYICILRLEHLLTHMEDVWDRIRTSTPGMPRTLNFITGPSRTADVEQTIQLGAHGPRRLAIVLIED